MRVAVFGRPARHINFKAIGIHGGVALVAAQFKGFVDLLKHREQQVSSLPMVVIELRCVASASIYCRVCAGLSSKMKRIFSVTHHFFQFTLKIVVNQ